MKEFKTIEEQICIIKRRGLIIKNEEFVKRKLLENNYYNIINGYKDIFIDRMQNEEKFLTNVTFEEIFALYSFDRNIRNIFLYYIIALENMFKSFISYEFSKEHGHDNYLKYSNFETLATLVNKKSDETRETIENRAFKINYLLAEMQYDLAQATKNSKYVKHYVVNYGFVPFWVLVNSITLGRLSVFFSLMKQPERVAVAKKFGILETDLRQYIKILALYRNRCAHGERIYNYNTERASISDTKYHYDLHIPQNNNRYIFGKNDLFAFIIILKRLLPKNDFEEFCNRLLEQLDLLSKEVKKDRFQHITSMMGLPHNWLKIKES